MNCVLCDKPIDSYNAEFHHLKIDDSKEFDICPGCLDKIIAWQSKIASRLFPTKLLKRKWGNKEETHNEGRRSK